MRENYTSLLGTLCLSLLLGCATESVSLDVTFDGPTGLVVAGAEEEPRLFVANAGEGKIRVLNLGESLKDVQFEESSLIYFPLEVEAGYERGFPTTLVSTSDGAYVLALDQGLGVLHLIDAHGLDHLGRYAAEDLVGEALGLEGARISAVAARACEAPCRGEFVVALGGSGKVAIISLSGTLGAEVFEVSSVLDAGGEVREMELSLDGDTLYFSGVDIENGWFLGALSLDRGVLTGVVSGLAWVPGALSVSGEGDLLLVARPDQRDVVLFSLDGAVLSGEPLDVDGVTGPSLNCINSCTPVEGELECGGHSGATALCANSEGLASTDQEYRGLYLAGTPSRLLSLGTSKGQPVLRVPCEDESEASFERVYSEYALVATLDGVIRYIGLELEEAEPAFLPELVSFGWCREGTLEVVTPGGSVDGAVAEAKMLSALALDDCPEVPERTRFDCLGLASDEDGSDLGLDPHGVVALGGLTYAREVRFDWEGSVSAALVRERGGDVTEDGDFRDIFYSLGQHGEEIQAGDILEITSEVELTSACRQALGLSASETLSSNCALERRIVTGPTEEDPVLRLNEPLPKDCFAAEGKVGYRIRMGDSFRVTISPGGSYRVRPGERFGPGGDAGRGEALLFDLASVTAPQELGPCERYFENGLPTEENSPLFRRSILGDVDAEFLDNSFGFTAQERDYAGNLTTYNLGSGLIVETGLRLETDYSAPAISGSAGVLPGTMIVTDSWGKGLEPVVVVSYTGQNSVLAMIPYTPGLSSDRFEDGNYFLLE